MLEWRHRKKLLLLLIMNEIVNWPDQRRAFDREDGRPRVSPDSTDGTVLPSWAVCAVDGACADVPARTPSECPRRTACRGGPWWDPTESETKKWTQNESETKWTWLKLTFIPNSGKKGWGEVPVNSFWNWDLSIELWLLHRIRIERLLEELEKRNLIEKGIRIE